MPMLPNAPVFPESAFLSRSPEAGLQLALQAAGIQPGDYVLAPTLASAELAGALRRAEAMPILFDVDPNSWLLDLDLLENFLMGHTLVNDEDVLVLRRDGKPVRAMVIVHLNGNPADLSRLRFIAHRFYIKLIEDACEATGARYADKPVGIYGDSGVFCLDGHPDGQQDRGALLLSADLASFQKLPEQALFKRYPEEFHLVRLHLEQLPALQQARITSTETAEIIHALFKEIQGIQWQQTLPQAEAVWHTLSFRYTQAAALRAVLEEAGVTNTTFTPPLHRLPAFQHCTYIRMHDYARQLFDSCIRIPETSQKTAKDWRDLSELIRNFLPDPPSYT